MQPFPIQPVGGGWDGETFPPVLSPNLSSVTPCREQQSLRAELCLAQNCFWFSVLTRLSCLRFAFHPGWIWEFIWSHSVEKDLGPDVKLAFA